MSEIEFQMIQHMRLEQLHCSAETVANNEKQKKKIFDWRLRKPYSGGNKWHANYAEKVEAVQVYI